METKELLEDIKKTFHDFKESNDKRISELEKGKDDFLSKTEVETINQKLDEVSDRLKEAELNISRPGVYTGKDDKDTLKSEHEKAFEHYFKTGEVGKLVDLQAKAHSIGTDAAGGYAVPEVIDRAITDRLVEVSPMRQLATVVSTTTEDYKKLLTRRGTASGWVGETDARAETNTSTLEEIPAIMGEIYANPASTQRAIDDVFFDVPAFMSSEVLQEFAYQEGVAFFTGDASNKPDGILTVTTATTADSARAHGTFQHIASGASGALSDPDKLIDITAEIKAGYRAASKFCMSRATLATIRKMKDSQNQYLWQPALSAGNPSSLVGFPVVEAEDMPAIAANALSVGFGDWARAYTIVDRIGTRVIRDELTNKPYVHFYTTRRVGGMPCDSEAVKFIKIDA